MLIKVKDNPPATTENIIWTEHTTRNPKTQYNNQTLISCDSRAISAGIVITRQ